MDKQRANIVSILSNFGKPIYFFPIGYLIKSYERKEYEFEESVSQVALHKITEKDTTMQNGTRAQIERKRDRNEKTWFKKNKNILRI